MLSFEEITPREKKKILYTCVASAVLCFVCYKKMNRIYAIFILFFLICGCAIDPIIPLCIKICIAPFELAVNANLALFNWFLVAFPLFYTYTMNRTRLISKTSLFAITLCGLSFGLSFILGENSQFSTLVIQLLIIICFLSSADSSRRNSSLLIMSSFMISANATLIRSLVVFNLGNKVTQ